MNHRRIRPGRLSKVLEHEKPVNQLTQNSAFGAKDDVVDHVLGRLYPDHTERKPKPRPTLRKFSWEGGA